jgi:hypothetical protein
MEMPATLRGSGRRQDRQHESNNQPPGQAPHSRRWLFAFMFCTHEVSRPMMPSRTGMLIGLVA